MRSLLEHKLWLFDFIFIIYFTYLTLFNKPQWCTARNMLMTDNCAEDIYGNNYYLISFTPFVERDVFMLTMLIMCYFNAKYYGIYRNLRRNVEILSSTRKTKLMLISALNLAHFTCYFLTRDNMVKLDLCSVIRIVFLLVVV